MESLSIPVKLEILDKLEDQELELLFSTNKAFAKLNNEDFWQNRIVTRFNLANLREKPALISAKSYYKFLRNGYRPTEESLTVARTKLDVAALDVFFELGMIKSIDVFGDEIFTFPILIWSWQHGFDVNIFVQDAIIYLIEDDLTRNEQITQIVNFFIDKIRFAKSMFTQFLFINLFDLAKKLQDKYGYRLSDEDMKILFNRSDKVFKDFLAANLVLDEEISDYVDHYPFNKWELLIESGYIPSKNSLANIMSLSSARSIKILNNILVQHGLNKFKEILLPNIPIYKDKTEVYIWLINNDLISENMATSSYLLNNILFKIPEQARWNYLFKTAEAKNKLNQNNLAILKQISSDKSKLEAYLRLI